MTYGHDAGVRAFRRSRGTIADVESPALELGLKELAVADDLWNVSFDGSSASRVRVSDPLERFVAHLETADRRGAIRYAEELLDDGLSAAELVLDVLVPAQATVGLNWARGAWSVEMEHIATDITGAVLAVAGVRADPRPDRGRLVVVCAETERHSLPAPRRSASLRPRSCSKTSRSSPTSPHGYARAQVPTPGPSRT